MTITVQSYWYKMLSELSKDSSNSSSEEGDDDENDDDDYDMMMTIKKNLRKTQSH